MLTKLLLRKILTISQTAKPPRFLSNLSTHSEFNMYRQIDDFFMKSKRQGEFYMGLSTQRFSLSILKR